MDIEYWSFIAIATLIDLYLIFVYIKENIHARENIPSANTR